MKQPNAEGESKASEAARVSFASAGADLVRAHAPKALAQVLRKRVPVTVSYAGGTVWLPVGTYTVTNAIVALGLDQSNPLYSNL